jgi:hypothetical protein
MPSVIPLGAVAAATVLAASALDVVAASIAALIGLAALIAAPRYIRRSQVQGALSEMQARLEEKDKNIQTHLQTIEALRERDKARDDDVAYLRGKLEQTEERARQYQGIAEGFQGRYEEQSKYTAKEALGTIEALINLQAEDNERRHRELITVLNSISELLGERRSTERRTHP